MYERIYYEYSGIQCMVGSGAGDPCAGRSAVTKLERFCNGEEEKLHQYLLSPSYFLREWRVVFAEHCVWGQIAALFHLYNENLLH